ncbi:GNAT family N-acetyltransferase [Maritalea mediterranea]|uniref:GNAT family N-acetyltransferase n=1 Tax=Maritalea mediterranea TaxID=2909667 RepID=A0ABS9E7A6_9HYPH|nr:GNAT family N-acetyltransferase [Maritalea mediterranea]MCF4098765.1 GNAT family N-acetyltransferase [Maritalea mediterranea]
MGEKPIGATKVKIVPIADEHWDQLPDIHRAAILAVPNKFHDRTARESWAHGLIPEGYKQSAQDGEVFFVALDENDCPIGFSGHRGYEMTALFVAPEHQHKGVATALYNRTISEILKGRPEKIVLTSSHPALGFYEKQGFIAVQEREEITRGGAFILVFDMEAPVNRPPHEGRELDLMLGGRKKIAYFGDNDPEETFRPYVISEQIKRYVWQERADYLQQLFKESGQLDIVPVAPVIYYLPQYEAEKDRLVTLLRKHMIEGEHDLREELEMSELLGYPSYAVKAFLERMRAMRQN